MIYKKIPKLENIFYIASYFGRGIYIERLSNQQRRIIAPIK